MDVSISCVTIVCFLCLSHLAFSEDLNLPSVKQVPLTFQKMREKGMTSFLDQKIQLRARFTWNYADVKIPEDPTSISVLRKKAGCLHH